ncbi:MAG: tryptophan 2,3-dioxygenase family protein [Actinomycetota bacterium]|nr:tryptophan 2,3-dioxygenase family protein [Actinomycetota bacterium]MDH5224462.1 tryptophan 2,3-dioxygenase family protein [Actinomycetota bacterium]MDH5312600.1 tryptophan 2,3-dioxygenase family protein [Actinomycetota bacterium]
MSEGEGRQRRFGRLTDEADQGLLTYGSYLKIPELLSLQHLKSEPPVHDELLFIVVHQAYELWFKQLLFELEAARHAMVADRPERARHLLARVRAIERVLIEHIEVLKTMTPQDFLEFRAVLTPASGFQSAQFREIEFVSGLKDERFLDDLAPGSDERARLVRRLEAPTVWDGFVSLMRTHGYPMPDDDAPARAASLVEMARARGEVFAVSEGLVDHDEALAQWRYLHVLMVEREIGAKRGTGGSSGVSYLRSTLDKRCFPELWGLRSGL